MTCKSCQRMIRITSAIRAQGWVECDNCHAVYGIAAEQDPSASKGYTGDARANEQAVPSDPPREASSPGASMAADPFGAGSSDRASTTSASDAGNSAGSSSAVGAIAGGSSSGGGFFDNLVNKFYDSMKNKPAEYETPSGPRPVVPLPKMIAISKGDGLDIQRRWFTAGSVFWLFFAVFWDFFVFTFIAFFFMDGFGEFPFPVLIHAGIGVFITYKSICDLVNRTHITVKQGTMSIKHGPLWWPGERSIKTADVAQLFVRKVIFKSSKGGTSITYNLEYLDRANQSQVFIKGFTQPEQALFLEQEIEAYLGISDMRVAGSYVG